MPGKTGFTQFPEADHSVYRLEIVGQALSPQRSVQGICSLTGERLPSNNLTSQHLGAWQQHPSAIWELAISGPHQGFPQLSASGSGSLLTSPLRIKNGTHGGLVSLCKADCGKGLKRLR